MAHNISALTPEIIRAEAESARPHFLIGKWITFDDDKIKGKRFILNTEIQFHGNASSITFVAINKKGFDQIATSLPVEDKNLISGFLPFFNAEDGKGHIKTDDGQTLAFSIADQSETPGALREQMKLLEQFPAGENIHFSEEITNKFSPPLSYREAIISGYMVSIRTEDKKWVGMVAFRDAIRPTEESFRFLPAYLLLRFGIKPALRPTNDGQQGLRRRLDA